MRKKKLILIIVCTFVMAMATSAICSLKHYQQKDYTGLQIGEFLSRVDSAWEDLDGDWKMQSFSQVTPYCYQNKEGNTINYYCCKTTYLSDEPAEVNGLNKTALDLVINVDSLENCHDCTVNGVVAVLGELDGQTYLCWTLSPVYSCVIEVEAKTVSEEDLFRMAESVMLPA